MGRLQDRRDMRPADGAAPVVGVQDYRLEGLLAQPVRRQPRVAEHRPRPVPGLAEVQFHRGAEDQLQQVSEVRRCRRVG